MKGGWEDLKNDNRCLFDLSTKLQQSSEKLLLALFITDFWTFLEISGERIEERGN
jgi:hypothetical protein